MRADLLDEGLHPNAAAVALLLHDQAAARRCVRELALVHCARATADEDDPARALGELVDQMLSTILGEREWQALREHLRILDTARHHEEYADSGAYAKAIYAALPGYAVVREVYEPLIVATPNFHDWYYEIGLACAWLSDHEAARSFWGALAWCERPCRDAITELGFFECRWGEHERAEACLSRLLAWFPDDEAIPRLRARIDEVRGST